MSGNRTKPTGLPIINEFAAGIDIGSRFHVVAVGSDLCDEPVQTFQAFTSDLLRMTDWLTEVGIKTVAMESTGVYWVAAYEVLESHGINVILANAREARAVPGRKSDVNDAQWLQRLHACGLLRASFRPGREIAALRSYLRSRERHLDYAASHIQHMQKALTYMNLQLHHVISDITGATGMQIIRAIVAGERNPDVLAEMRDVRCKATTETVRAALVGNYQPEHVFALKQALALYDFYQQCVAECDIQIEQVVAALNSSRQIPATPLPKARHRTKQPNDVNFDVRTAMYQLAGTDLTQIHGIGPFLALRLVGECGTDLTRWKTAKHFTSWLTLSPGCKISGGKVLSAHTRKTSNRLTVALRLAAVTVGRTNTALGAFYRRLAARIGNAKAVTATARKIAILFYNAMRFGIDYKDPGADHYEQQYRDRVIKQLHRRAAQFGLILQQQNPAIDECVS
jgi:transposase